MRSAGVDFITLRVYNKKVFATTCRCVGMADDRDSKSCAVMACGFESHHRHHSPSENTVFGRIFYAFRTKITHPESEIAKKEGLSPQISAIFWILGTTVLR